MTKEDDYRKNAAETVELASRATNTADKGHLLSLAKKLLDLADPGAPADQAFRLKTPKARDTVEYGENKGAAN